jgi:hypothetical protein
MPKRTLPCVAIALAFAPGAAFAGAGPKEDAQRDRVAPLVRQLGDRSFAKREAASRELAAIGEPARAALTNAAGDPDPEVGRRARQVLDALDVRALAAAAKLELARWEGEWTGNGGQKFVIKGDRWAWGTAGSWTLDERNGNLVLIVAVGERLIQADMVVGDPANGGRMCQAIFRLDGDTLHYCGSYGPVRPTDFRTTVNEFYVAWKRVKK